MLAHAALLSHPLPDAALFQALESGDGEETLHLWESPAPVVVLGRSGVPDRDADLPACAANGVPVMRRESGGGAVVLGPGCLNYALVLSLGRPELRDVRASYCLILKWLVRSLAVPGLEIRGASDLALGDRKVSGNSQRRGARALLHHGTLLYAFDSRLAQRYLREPARQPDYRAGRSHAEFLGNLPLTAAQIRAALDPQNFRPSKLAPTTFAACQAP